MLDVELAVCEVISAYDELELQMISGNRTGIPSIEVWLDCKEIFRAEADQDGFVLWMTYDCLQIETFEYFDYRAFVSACRERLDIALYRVRAAKALESRGIYILRLCFLAVL